MHYIDLLIIHLQPCPIMCFFLDFHQSPGVVWIMTCSGPKFLAISSSLFLFLWVVCSKVVSSFLVAGLEMTD